jgi:hypothetical protein
VSLPFPWSDRKRNPLPDTAARRVCRVDAALNLGAVICYPVASRPAVGPHVIDGIAVTGESIEFFFLLTFDLSVIWTRRPQSKGGERRYVSGAVSGRRIGGGGVSHL